MMIYDICIAYVSTLLYQASGSGRAARAIYSPTTFKLIVIHHCEH